MANKYFRKYISPAASSEVTLYTVPDANTAILSSLRVTNGNTDTAVIDVNVYPGGGGTAYAALKQHAIPTDGTMDVFSGIPFVVEAEDVLKVKSSKPSVNFYLSYLEMDRN
jgi:hypothetical protein